MHAQQWAVSAIALFGMASAGAGASTTTAQAAGQHATALPAALVVKVIATAGQTISGREVNGRAVVTAVTSATTYQEDGAPTGWRRYSPAC